MDFDTLVFIVVIGFILCGGMVKSDGLLKHLRRRRQPESKELTDGERECKLLNE